jgi:hypothetical protein
VFSVCTFTQPSLDNNSELHTCSYERFPHNDRYYHLPKYLNFLLNHPVFCPSNKIFLYAVPSSGHNESCRSNWWCCTSIAVRCIVIHRALYKHNKEQQQQQHGKCSAEQLTVLFLLHVLARLGWEILELYIKMYCLLRNTLFFLYIAKIGAGMVQSV